MGSQNSKFFRAVKEGNHAIVEEIVKSGDVDVNAVDEEEKLTALHYAARHGHVDVATVLIQNGADANAGVKTHDLTPLHFAAQNGHVEVAKLLVRKVIDIHYTAWGTFVSCKYHSICDGTLTHTLTHTQLDHNGERTGQHFTSHVSMDMPMLRNC